MDTLEALLRLPDAVDHFLFDNPELKRTAYAWLTDFVGWLPMPEGGAAEAALTADWNAERVERMRRYPRLRRGRAVGGWEALVREEFRELARAQ